MAFIEEVILEGLCLSVIPEKLSVNQYVTHINS